MPHPFEQPLSEGGDARREADRIQAETIAELRQLVREAHEQGMTKTRIAQVAGLSRQTVHEILKGAKR